MTTASSNVFVRSNAKPSSCGHISLFPMIVKTMLAILTAVSGCHSYSSLMDLPQNCLTNPSTDFFNLKCVDSNQHSINIYSIEHTLHVTHNEGLVVIDLKTFPRLSISQELRNVNQDIRRVKMENCTLPDGVSFGTLFEHFGIEDEILAFEGINITRSPLSLDGRFSSGFERVENLTLSKNGIRQLNEHVFRSLTNLSNLDLRRNEIIAVHENVFKNLTELRTLKLSWNVLKSLSAGMFEQQKHLNFLSLHRNRLQSLTKEMFRGLDSLNVLSLEKNNFSGLTDNVFHNIPRLQKVSLGNGNMRIPYRIFTKQSLLKYVFLEKVKLNEGLHLSGLQILQIKLSEIMTISGLSNIESVVIIECQLHRTAVASFSNLSSTKTLNLPLNKISNLVDGLFDGLKELVQLKLSKNYLTNISGLVFRDLHNLNEIDLSDNRITTIHPNAFANTYRLTIINLKNNQLSFADSKLPFVHLHNLTILNLSNNKVTKMPTDLMRLKNLKEVDLSFNRIGSVTFSELRQNFMNLSSTYETRSALGSKDTRTYLQDNPLNCDCSMFDFLSGTDQRQLAPAFSHNCYKDPYHLKPCHRETYLSDKCPTECSCTDRGDKSGLHIFISCKGKQLTRLPAIKFENASSIELDVSNNSLTELPILHTNLQVTFIQASFNQISNIELENLPPNLRGLDLSHNKVQTIAATVIQRMKYHKSLEIFLFKDNPLTCHCSSEDTVQFIEFVKENSSITDLQQAKCNVHYELSMEVLQKNCTKNVMINSLIIVTILTLISGVLLVLFIKHRQFIKMWLYAHDWLLWWVDEEYLDRDKVYDVFISYANKNQLLAYRITDALEKDDIYKVCLHERDFLGGERIEKSVYDAVHKSRRTLVILSENYGDSAWCEYEFHLAWERSVIEKRKVIIAVKDGNLGNIADETIQSYIKTHTYIESKDEWFWERLIFRLPHKKTTKNIFPIRDYEALKEEESANEGEPVKEAETIEQNGP